MANYIILLKWIERKRLPYDDDDEVIAAISDVSVFSACVHFHTLAGPTFDQHMTNMRGPTSDHHVTNICCGGSRLGG